MNIEDLKMYSKYYWRHLPKELIEHIEICKGMTNMGITMNYIKDKKKYEVFAFVQYDKKTVGGLSTRIFSKKIFAYFYYNFLLFLINYRNERKILRMLRKQNKHKKNTKKVHN